MRAIIVDIGLVALCWGGWPLVARWAGKTGSTGTMILVATALFPVGIMFFRDGPTSVTASALWKLGLAGVMMGTGMVAFQMVATSSLVNISTTVPIINTLMLIVTTIGGVWFFSEPLTLQKVFAVALLITGILLLRPSG